MFRKEVPQSLIVKGMDQPPKMKTVTENDYLYNPSVGVHVSPFDAAAATYDVSGNVMYDRVNHDQHAFADHSDKMKEIHRSMPNDKIMEALNVITKAAPKESDAGEDEDKDTGENEDNEAGEDETESNENDSEKSLKCGAEEAVDEREGKTLKKSAVEFALDELAKGGVGSRPKNIRSEVAQGGK